MILKEPLSEYILCIVSSLKNKAFTDIKQERLKINIDNFIIGEL